MSKPVRTMEQAFEQPVRVDVRPRRGLRRDDAALYCGVSPSKFDELVRDGRMPNPTRLDGCVLWDVRKLDLAWDMLSNGDGNDTWGDFQ